MADGALMKQVPTCNKTVVDEWIGLFYQDLEKTVQDFESK